MGGISVLVVLGLFMSFYALYLFLIFISIFYLVENYIFESLFLYNKTHSKKSWIPYYSKYLLGKEVALEKEGLDRKSTRLNSSHRHTSRMPSSA